VTFLVAPAVVTGAAAMGAAPIVSAAGAARLAAVPASIERRDIAACRSPGTPRPLFNPAGSRSLPVERVELMKLNDKS